ncbi:rho guanine nucleotide exchange factor 19-like [Hypanus sabinus]|uniref:rho guanine nucleotide exchange factor 19-like n=1 Tax=Hypanus sabinus TaxID=79690 RepID=UPI0028C450C8|nr:rho guanine nucleotide exchange factor 19-like [Hypanus sabinus]
MDYYTRRELTASTPGGQRTEQTCPIGEEIAGLPLLGGHHSPRTLSIGQEHTESVLDDRHSERTHPIGQKLIELPLEDHHSERARPIGQQQIELPLEDHQSERTRPIGQQQIELPMEDHQSERARPIGQNLTESPLDGGTRAKGEGLHESGSGLTSLAPGDHQKETVHCAGQELSAPTPGGPHVEGAPPPVGREDVGDRPDDRDPPGDGRAERRDGVSGGPRGPYDGREEGGGEEVVDGPRGKVQVYFLVGCPEEAEEEGFRRRAATLPAGRPSEAGSQRRAGATLRRQDALEAQGEAGWEAEGHPPLAKSSSCPTPEERETGPAENPSDTRSGSRDWHRRGIRRPSMATIIMQGGEEGSAEGSARTETPDAGGSRPGEVNLRRRGSRILQICQPLYQEYIHQALDREIRRQRPSDACPSPEGLRGRRGPSLLQRASLGNPTGLWRDLPEVRNSTDLDSLSPEESKLQEVKFELISSEASYLRSLDIAVNHFQGSKTLNALLVPQERQWLFSKLPAVRAVSQR